MAWAGSSGLIPNVAAVPGRNCMSPIAPAEGRAFGLKFDSARATAASRPAGAPYLDDAWLNSSAYGTPFTVLDPVAPAAPGLAGMSTENWSARSWASFALAVCTWLYAEAYWSKIRVFGSNALRPTPYGLG